MVQGYKRRTFELLNIVTGARVLDVGCGRGDDVIAIARLVGPTGRPVGVDRSSAMLDVARQAARQAGVRAEFVEADAVALPFPDGAFDACRIDRTLEHLAEPEAAVRELARVCRSGGRVAAFEPDWDTLTVEAPDLATTRSVVDAHSDTYAHGTVGRSLRRILVAAGLTDLVAEPVTLSSDELKLAEAMLGLRLGLIEAVKARRIVRADADAWWRSLETADASGTFWATLTGTIAVGTKP